MLIMYERYELEREDAKRSVNDEWDSGIFNARLIRPLGRKETKV